MYYWHLKFSGDKNKSFDNGSFVLFIISSNQVNTAQ